MCIRDSYVSINYKSFVEVVDVLGGVTVPITENEAAFMNRTTKVKGFESGESVRLNGQRALIYSRIRKLDSEVERTRRQREVISSVIRNVKASSFGDLNKAIETFLPYVTTNFKSGEILSLGTQALSEGWMNYEIVSMVEPSEEYRYGVDHFQTYSYNDLFVWIVDYIKAARELQLALYDQTNIEIDPMTHISAIDLAKGSASTSGDNYSDDDYDGEKNYETHYYTEAESTTKRKSVFGWLGDNRNDETEPDVPPEETFEYTDGGNTDYEETSSEGDEGSDEPYSEKTYPQITMPAFGQ